MALLVVLHGSAPAPLPPPPPDTGFIGGATILAEPYREPLVTPWKDTGMSGPTFTYEYVTGAELPALRVPWADGSGFDIDFSSAWTFELRIGHLGLAPLVTKTNGISGGLGFIDVVWSASISADLNLLPVGRYDCQLRARRVADGSDRIRVGQIIISEGIL